MKKAIYVGSFNPWHKGRQDVLDKALKVFDQVDVITYGKEGIGWFVLAVLLICG